jgi:hypothetical protein
MGGLFRLRNVTIVGYFHYLILLKLKHVSVVRSSSGRGILARITRLATDPFFFNIVNIIVNGLVVGCLPDVVAVVGVVV